MPNVTVDPLAIAALVGFASLIIVSVGVVVVFWKLSKQSS